jgi:hypothetical protein
MTVVPTGVVRRLGIASDSKNEIILRTPAPQRKCQEWLSKQSFSRDAVEGRSGSLSD